MKLQLKNAVDELLYQVAHLALVSGDAWRQEHAELIDAFEACWEILNEEVNNAKN